MTVKLGKEIQVHVRGSWPNEPRHFTAERPGET